MNVVLFFGSFNPVHIGHLIIANHIVQEKEVDQLWFVVSPHNPLKEKKSLLKGHHRLYMVQEAIDDNTNLRASDIEFGMPQPSYTSDTLAYLKEKHPTYKFSLLMGEDNLRGFHKWKNYEQILAHHSIYVFPRIKEEKDAAGDEKTMNHSSFQLVKDVPVMKLSATHIRNQIKNNKSIQYLVHPKVEKYIDEMGFYKQPTSS